ncbi:naringenin-chalcone synthase [Halobacillus yeomjeoni]|uniref:Naringenin-chalcone synthase n=1 Tax=Halobacillus yeomjeoni TaxID=311194 RepID=A0A931HU03_9BACI|nr:3-oxoacyl-[acyl-carrier-protein] synthase III C-terminal domain-containing protein [Halobacillus yeomjeoni]MBH0229525.1 naringenin-chalcone synthase [Halobacillus yeomjeoni]MCA0983074.1 naringenin-chalcone synthase [Halobacillus yeomjeoni]
MAFILSSGIHLAEHDYPQSQIKTFVEDVFPLKANEKKRLLPIFENTNIERRQLAMPLEWFAHEHGLEVKNDIYQKKAIEYTIAAVRSCLEESVFLKKEVRVNQIDHIIFVSSTGIATPTIDTYILNELKFEEGVKRTPLFGLGCAGGTSGVAKGYEYLKGHPKENVLVVCVELCSLTFQHNDTRVSNFVGTALFADGASAVLLAGEESELKSLSEKPLARVTHASSKTKYDSTDVMGWQVVDSGFEVIFKKSIPRLVRDFWSQHVREVLEKNSLEIKDIPFIVAHPGGRKVLETYQEIFDLREETLAYSTDILRKHGNMSSPTVHYVLNQAMKGHPEKGTKSFMTSLGPGFSSEICTLEWV